MFFRSEGTLKTTQLSTYLQNPPKHPPRVPNLVKNDVSMAKWASKMVPKRHPKSSGFGSKMVLGHNLHHMPPKWCPKGIPNLQVLARKWFWAITCTIWLRLKFRGRGSAWFFSAHLLYFHAQGQILEPRIGFWIPRSTFWPGDLFGPKNNPEKRCFVEE